MRPLLHRGTFRAASRLLAANPSQTPPTVRPVPVSSRACTSSAASADTTTKTPTTPPTSQSSQPNVTSPPPSESPLAPLDEHAHPLPPTEKVSGANSQSHAVTNLSASSVSSVEAEEISPPPETNAHGSVVSDPTELLAQLRDLLSRNAVRSSLFHFASALKKHDAPSVDPEVLKLILPILGRQGWGDTSRDSLNLALDRGYNLGSGIYNCGLHALSRTGDSPSVKNVIDRMWALQPESRPNATSYNYLIGTFMYRNMVDEAFDVLNSMKEHLIYPTFATYHALITGCLRARDPKRAYSTLTAVESQRFEVGAMTITQVLVACAQADLVPESIDLLNRAVDALPRYKSEVHRIAETRLAYRMARLQRTTPDERASIRGDPRIETAAIHEVMQSAFRNGSAELAMAGWSVLKSLYPDREIEPHLWYCLIGAFSSAGDFTRAFDALATMREEGLKINMRALETALIRPMSRDISVVDEQYYRLVDRVKSTSTSMGSEQETQAKGSDSEVTDETTVNHTIDDGAIGTPGANDEITQNTVVGTEEDAATGIPDKSEVEIGLSDDTLTLKDVISARKVADDLQEVYSWKEMAPTTVGIEELNTIIWSCSLGKDLDRAFQTYDEVEQTFHLIRNVDTFNALLEGCIEVRHVRGGMRILTEMEKAGLQASGETVNLMSRLYTRSNQVDDAINIIEATVQEGGKVSAKTFSNVLRYLIRGEAIEKAASLYNIGVSAGHSDRVLLGRLDRDSLKKLRSELGLNTEQGLEEVEVIDAADGTETSTEDNFVEDNLIAGDGSRGDIEKER